MRPWACGAGDFLGPEEEVGRWSRRESEGSTMRDRGEKRRRRRAAERVVHRYTAIAAATGAVPVPAASGAIVAESAVMIAEIASVLEQPVTLQMVLRSIGTLGTINLIGRQVFVEGARLLGWGAGPGGIMAVSALGASTAGIQTWVLGHLAIAVAENGGRPLPPAEARVTVEAARASYREPKRARAGGRA